MDQKTLLTNSGKMVWKTTGDKWLDKWIDQVIKFSNELDSMRCHLPESTKKEIKDCLAQLNKINNKNPFNESYS